MRLKHAASWESPSHINEKAITIEKPTSPLARILLPALGAILIAGGFGLYVALEGFLSLAGLLLVLVGTYLYKPAVDALRQRLNNKRTTIIVSVFLMLLAFVVMIVFQSALSALIGILFGVTGVLLLPLGRANKKQDQEKHEE